MRIKLLTVIGARPQIIKAAAISRVIVENFHEKFEEVIVHTGQHYDENMSRVFFEELEIPKEKYNLQVGSGTHAEQTAGIMVEFEEVLKKEKPHAVLLYGDTNSTLAASVAAIKLHYPIIHIEGGVRSFNKYFPEEVNRIVCDHLSSIIFTPTQSGFNNLLREGFTENNKKAGLNNTKIIHSGDIMYDNSLYYSKMAEEKINILNELNIKEEKFILLTIHRPSNTEDIDTLLDILKSVNTSSIQQNCVVVAPLHPRTKKILEKNASDFLNELKQNQKFIIIRPLTFLEITLLEKKCSLVITDSGGVQKEAYYFKKPCVILLDETPWVELQENGSSELTGSNPEKIKEAIKKYFKEDISFVFPPIFGDGNASSFILNEIYKNLS